jgi:hypothetical protein
MDYSKINVNLSSSFEIESELSFRRDLTHVFESNQLEQVKNQYDLQVNQINNLLYTLFLEGL